jgi:hypothetical protein
MVLPFHEVSLYISEDVLRVGNRYITKCLSNVVSTLNVLHICLYLLNLGNVCYRSVQNP